MAWTQIISAINNIHSTKNSNGIITLIMINHSNSNILNMTYNTNKNQYEYVLKIKKYTATADNLTT